MSVMQQRHKAATLCTLGDGTLVAPSYPGANERADNYSYSTSSYVAFDLYPSTTPDELVSLIRYTGTANPATISLLTGPCGADNYCTVTTGFPPAPIGGSPFTLDTRTSTPYANIYPRWTGETAWDLQTFPATDSFTPQGLVSIPVFNYANPGLGDAARFGVSYITGTLPNDPMFGGDSTYQALAEFKVFAQASEVCCWNEGATIEVNLDIWKVDFTATYTPGTYGQHDFTLGTPVHDHTLTQTLTVDASWESASPVLVHTFTISPPASGAFYFVNDYYVSSVTAP